MSSRSQREPRLEALLHLADDAGIVDEPSVQRLLAAATVTDSGAFRRQVEQVLAARAVQRQRQPFYGQPPLRAPGADHLSLGVTVTGSTYAVEQADLTQHLLAIGQSGAGKTTLFYNLMEQLTVPFWAFDLKQDYRHHLQRDEDLLVLPWTELKLNPLQPPEGVPPRRWAQVFSEIFGHATALLSGSKNYLLTQLIDLYRQYDLFNELDVPYPSLHELQVVMQQDKLNYVRKQATYRDTVVNRLQAMNLAAGTIFDCSQGYPLEDLLGCNVVFEFDGLSRDLQNFVMEILFAAVYEYRLAQNHRGGGLRHVFLLDEGKQIFSVYKERQDAAGLPAIDELTAKMREFGEGLVVADQEATKLTDSLKANTATKVLLATGDAKQFDNIAASMHLTDRQADIARSLGVGQAIVQTGGRDPVAVQLDNVDVEKTMTDAALRKAQLARWNALSTTPREVPATLDDQVGQPANTSQQPVSIPDDPAPTIEVSERANRLLIDAVEQPFVPLSERYTRCASMEKGVAAKQELLNAGLVRERSVTTRQAKRKLLELTEQGREYVETQLDLETTHHGRGGIVHRYWQHRLIDLFEAAGWVAKPELFDADVYATLAGTEVAVEVAMGNNGREADHVAQHLANGLDAVWVVCQNRAVEAGLRERLAERGLVGERVTLRLFQDVAEAENTSMEDFGAFGRAE